MDLLLRSFYEVVIRPVEYLIGIVFRIMYDFWGNEGIAIISVSILVSLLTLPLYLRADAVQETEQNKQKKMEFWSGHIKKAFSGDERYLIQSAYYREMGYKPLDALKGTLSLLLQIPFFLAAYRYLSTLQVLQGSSFGPIADLGAPDNLLVIGGIKICVLPILMTLINCVSGTIYTQGRLLRQRVQVYVLALVFLVLLYNSPAGLVLYWTMNNLFSLCKNIVTEKLCKKKKKKSEEKDVAATGVEKRCIKLTLLALTLFMGAYIPLSVVSASPADLVNLFDYVSPLRYVWLTFCVCAGLFMVWGGVIDSVVTNKGRLIYGYILLFLLAAGLVDFMFFYPEIGMVSRELTFDWTPRFPWGIKFINLIVLMFIALVTFFLWWKQRKVIGYVVLIVCLSIGTFSLYKLVQTNVKLTEIKKDAAVQNDDVSFRLSSTEKNVVVIMLDRTVGAYMPFILSERPELMDELDGFTFYPNTVSTGLCTNYGLPAVYGGYDYTTSAMNERSDELLRDKHNEALKLMPVLFSEEGYDVLTCDAQYANYHMPSDYSIFDNMENVTALHLEGRFKTAYGAEEHTRRVERSFFFYSIYKIMPSFWQDEVYDDGQYLSTDVLAGDEAFLEAYAVLHRLPEFTTVDDGCGSFIMLSNNTTHEPSILQLPDYTVCENTDNSDFGDVAAEKEADGKTLVFDRDNLRQSVGQYHVHVRAMMEIADWCEELKKMGVYDNTRIILVADHGRATGGIDDAFINDDIDVLAANPLLMVKDFDAHGFTTDTEFMTNADVPALAMEGIVENPVNPFTNHPVDMRGKENGVDVFWAYEGDIYKNNGTVFGPDDAAIYHVDEDIFSDDNWECIREN